MQQRTIITIGFVLLFYGAVPAAFGSTDYVISSIVAALTIAGIAVAWALLGNLGGMVSFGHAAFFGVGAYVSALLTMNAGWPVFAAMIAGGAGASIASVAIMPALRLRGPYFALAILAYAGIFRILATEMEGITRGAAGLLSIPRLPTILGFDLGTNIGSYYVILTIVLAAMAAYAWIRRSEIGFALLAMHETEDATRILGVPSTRLKAMMLVLSAFITGIVGAFNAHHISFLDPDYAFSGVWTVLPIVAAIFGGFRTVSGPFIGALAIYLLDQFVFKSLLPTGHQIILGAALGTMILLSPDGLVPLLGRGLGKMRHAAT